MKSFFRSVRHAVHGLVYVFKSERNFQIEVVLGGLALLLSLIFPLTENERLGVYGMVSLVLTLELINTAIERMLDMMKPHVHPYVKVIKDLMAGAVLVVAFFALVLGVVVFSPHIALLFGLAGVDESSIMRP